MIRQITPKELARMLANGHRVCLVDVRQPWESEIASIEGGKLIPLAELQARAGEVKEAAGPEDLVVLYCHHGVRSLTGARILQNENLTRVASLAGGIEAWSDEVDPSVPRY